MSEIMHEHCRISCRAYATGHVTDEWTYLSLKCAYSVIPQAGIQEVASIGASMDPGLRRDDGCLVLK